MISSNKKQDRIQIAKVISINLILRNSANELFNYINNLKASEIIIDFRKVQSITRAFAHQYLLNKEKSHKVINNVNLSPNIKNMFELIGKTNKI